MPEFAVNRQRSFRPSILEQTTLFPQHKMNLFCLNGLINLRGYWLVVACAMCCIALPAAAEEQDYAQQRLEEAPHPFNGSFSEWSARGGPLLTSSDSVSTGWGADVGLRNAFPMYLADHRISYRYATASMGERRVHLHDLHLAGALHPFYLALLSGGLKGHFLASLHLELGLGPRLGRLSSGGDDEGLSNFGVAASVGGGFDIPLTSPNRGRSLWINGLYRRTWSFVRFDLGDASPRLHDHIFFLGLAWRSNGSMW